MGFTRSPRTEIRLISINSDCLIVKWESIYHRKSTSIGLQRRLAGKWPDISTAILWAPVYGRSRQAGIQASKRHIQAYCSTKGPQRRWRNVVNRKIWKYTFPTRTVLYSRHSSATAATSSIRPGPPPSSTFG